MIAEEINVDELAPGAHRAKAAAAPEDAIEPVRQDYPAHGARRLFNVRQSADASAVESSSIFRPKSPTNRSKLLRCRPYQWRPNKFVPKTRSSALPSSHEAHDGRPRVETASTPDLVDNPETSDRDKYYHEEKNRHEQRRRVRVNRQTICYDNVRWICIFLNSVILILSLLFFGNGLAFTFTKDTMLLIMKNRIYVSLTVFFYVISFSYLILSLSGLYAILKKSRSIKIHASVSLILGIVTGAIIFMFNSTQRSIEDNVESHLMSTLDENRFKEPWDYYHNAFKCCGVTGFLDWCDQDDLYKKINESRSQDYLGTYVCSIPGSCCVNYENYTDTYSANKNVTCLDLLKLRKMRNVGCITFIRREIHHLGQMYIIMTGGATGVLILLTVMLTILVKYFPR